MGDEGVSSGGVSDAGLSATVAAGTVVSGWRSYRWHDCSARLRPPRVVVSGLAAGLPARRPVRRVRVRLAERRGGLPPAPARENPDGSRPAIRIRRAAEARPVGDPPARVIGWRLARWRVRSRCRRRAGCAAGRRQTLPPAGSVPRWRADGGTCPGGRQAGCKCRPGREPALSSR